LIAFWPLFYLANSLGRDAMIRRSSYFAIGGIILISSIACLSISSSQSECEPPYHGGFIKEEHCEFVELPRGTGYSPAENIPHTTSIRPVIFIWEPELYMGNLTLLDKNDDSVPFNAYSRDDVWELSLSNDLLPGEYCYRAGSPLQRMSSAPRWCFLVGEYSNEQVDAEYAETTNVTPTSDINQNPTLPMIGINTYINEVFYGDEAMKLLSYVDEYLSEPDPGWQKVAILITLENPSDSTIELPIPILTHTEVLDTGNYEHQAFTHPLGYSYLNFLPPRFMYPIILESEIPVNQTLEEIHFSFFKGITYHAFEFDVSQPEGIFYVPFKSPIKETEIDGFYTDKIEISFPNDFEYSMDTFFCQDITFQDGSTTPTMNFLFSITNLGGQNLNVQNIETIAFNEIGFNSEYFYIVNLDNKVIGPTITEYLHIAVSLPDYEKIDILSTEYSNYYFIIFSYTGNNNTSFIKFLAHCEEGVFLLP